MNENDLIFENLCKSAYKAEILSDLAALPTKYTYLQLMTLYDNFNKGFYSKEKCIELKNKIRKEYHDNLQEHDRDMECHREYLMNRNKNALLLATLEKTKNKDEMLDICLKIISNCVHDDSLYQRNISKVN